MQARKVAKSEKAKFLFFAQKQYNFEVQSRYTETLEQH